MSFSYCRFLSELQLHAGVTDRAALGIRSIPRNPLLFGILLRVPDRARQGRNAVSDLRFSRDVKIDAKWFNHFVNQTWGVKNENNRKHRR